jgi:hypothetical protein
MKEYKFRHKELVKEATQYRLVKEAHKASLPKVGSHVKILASIGKELVTLGVRLEERYGSQLDSRVTLSQQGNQGGC